MTEEITHVLVRVAREWVWPWVLVIGYALGAFCALIWGTLLALNVLDWLF